MAEFLLDLTTRTIDTWYRWDTGWNVIGEYADDSGSFWDVGGLEKTFVMRGMIPLADIAGSNPSTGAYRYYAHDHLGSTRSLFDASKDLVSTVGYTPYGTQTLTGEAVPFTFTSKPYEAETGQYYFPYRYYAPGLARWTSRDPLGMADGPNVYGYVGGDPVNSLDPSGLAQVCVGNMGPKYGYLFYHCAIKIDGKIYEYGHTAGYPDGHRVTDDDGTRNLHCTEAKGSSDDCCDEGRLKRALEALNGSHFGSRGAYDPVTHNCCHYINLALKAAGCKGVTSYDYIDWYPEAWYLPLAR